MSERREKSSRKKKVSSSLEQLSNTKKGKKETRLDQFEVEDIDESMVPEKPTETKKNSKTIVIKINFIFREKKKEK